LPSIDRFISGKEKDVERSGHGKLLVLLPCLLGGRKNSRYPAKHESETSRRQRRRDKHSKVKFGAGLINYLFFVDVFRLVYHLSSLSPVAF
jgi:hypothetical protein